MWKTCYFKEIEKKKIKEEGKLRLKILSKAASFNVLVFQSINFGEAPFNILYMVSDKITKKQKG